MLQKFGVIRVILRQKNFHSLRLKKIIIQHNFRQFYINLLIFNFFFSLFFNTIVLQQVIASDIMPPISTSTCFRMKQIKRFPIHCILLVLIFVLALQIQAQAQNDPENSSSMELNQIPTSAESTIDLSNIILNISLQRDPSLNRAILETQLNQLTENVRSRLKTNLSDDQVIQILRQVIHQEAGLLYTDQVDSKGIPLNPAELFLHGLLETKRGYCMNLSLIYLIIGDRLGLPLYGVALPNHFFVRYESEKTRINIEATEAGASYPDDFYRQRFGLVAGNDSFFMKNLSKKQTLGAYFSNVGMVYYQDRKVDRAINYLDLSSKINPRSIEAQNNLANIYTEQKK